MINVNDNIKVNAGKPLDAKYLNGVTPYVDVAAAIAAIPLAERSIGLTVNVNGDDYWWKNGLTDPDLILKSSGGGIIYVDTTRADLQNLIATSSLVPGTNYGINDFQDKNVNDPDSRVILLATSVNTISQSGFWKRTSLNRAYGAFTLNSGNSGSVDQITVGATALMTASVAYLTSRINTANLVASNINANSAISGYSAVVIPGDTTIDIPAIIIQNNIGGVDTSSIIVTVTTLTIANLTNMTMGRAQVDQTLDISYNITSDLITSCYDNVYNIRMTYTSERIVQLAYNPILNWRWGHSSFRNWEFYNVAYKDFYDFPSTSGPNTIEQNNNMIDGSFERIVIKRTSTVQLSLSNNTSNMNFSNVQALGSGSSQIYGNNIMLQLTNITCLNSISLNQNVGNYNKSAVSANTGRILIQNSSFSNTATINFNSVSGQIQFSTTSFTAALAVSSNNVLGSIISSSSSYVQSVTVSSNSINGSVTLPQGTNRDFVINITGNNFVNASLNCSALNISVVGKSLTVINNTFNKGSYAFNATATDTYNLSENYLNSNGNSLNINASTYVNMNNTTLTTQLNSSNFLIASLVLTNSFVDFTTINGSSLVGPSLTITDSKVRNIFYLGNGLNLTIQSSDINGLTLNNSTSNSSADFLNSNIQFSTLNVTGGAGELATVSFDGVRIYNSTLSTNASLINSAYIFQNSDIFKSNITTAGTVNNFIVSDTYFNEVVINPIGATPDITNITNCRITNSTVAMAQAADFSCIDTNISYCTISSNDATTFSFNKCKFEYNTIDFTTGLPGADYIISDMTLIKDRGLYKSIFTFDGTAGRGQAGTACTVITDMIGQDVLKSIITKATISTVTGLTAAAGANISLGQGTYTEYIPTTLVSTLNSNYQIKNEPVGVLTNATVYDFFALPTVGDITAGRAEIAIEFLVAP